MLCVCAMCDPGRKADSGYDSGQDLDLVATTMERKSPQSGNKGWQALTDIVGKLRLAAGWCALGDPLEDHGLIQV